MAEQTRRVTTEREKTAERPCAPCAPLREPDRLVSSDAARAPGRRRPSEGGDVNRVLILPRLTERLVLRDFRPGDFGAVHAYASDPEVARRMFWGPREEAEPKEYLERMLASQREGPRTVWELAVVRRADGRPIGASDLTLEDERTADLGYVLGREAWGRGYATEAALRMVRAGFRELGLRRIFAVCEVGHAASARVLRKAGLVFEATLEDYVRAKGNSWDVCRYGLALPERRAARAFGGSDRSAQREGRSAPLTQRTAPCGARATPCRPGKAG